ncbi:MAG: TonB C-terminal domain-containing protein [Verrucomicrobiota bacterium]|nr:TonB C-terminal domain-containing protein [Verrucomicrobiota bacterium]
MNKKMGQSKKDIFYRVLIIHVVVLIILFLFSFVKGCFKKEISSEIVTYIDFSYDIEPSPNVSTLENSTSQVSSKPKWKPKTVDEIVKGKKIEKIETNNEEKKKALNKLKNISKSNSIVNTYLAKVKDLIYSRWEPPNLVTANLKPVTLRLYINNQGQITKRTNVTLSNIDSYNKSINDAVKSIGFLPPPPNDYPYSYVEITFRVEGN